MIVLLLLLTTMLFNNKSLTLARFMYETGVIATIFLPLVEGRFYQKIRSHMSILLRKYQIL